jgi:hypothetical protein
LREEELPKIIKRKNTESVYISEYTTFYLQHKINESKKVKKPTIGNLIDQLILSQPDFKDVINIQLEKSKL